jgi:acyl-CoA hydrolase
MDWELEYKSKLTTREEAVKLVRSGDLVVLPLAGPFGFAPALAARRSELRDVTIRLSSPATDPGWYAEDWAESFNIEFELFIGDPNRHATDSGRATYLPNVFSTEFKWPDERPAEVRGPDVVFINVSPPNRNGYVNFGVHMWNKRAYARRARTVIAWKRRPRPCSAREAARRGPSLEPCSPCRKRSGQSCGRSSWGQSARDWRSCCRPSLRGWESTRRRSWLRR